MANEETQSMAYKIALIESIIKACDRVQDSYERQRTKDYAIKSAYEKIKKVMRM